LRGSLLNLPKTSSLLNVIASEATGLGKGSLLNLPMASSLLDLSAVAASSILARGSWLILTKASSLSDLVIVSREASFVSLRPSMGAALDLRWGRQLSLGTWAFFRETGKSQVAAAPVKLLPGKPG